MWVLSPEQVLNLVLNLVPMDTKFSTGGDGSHPGKHGIAAETRCSQTACSAAVLGVILPLFLFSSLTRTSDGILPVVILKLCKSATHACNDEMRTRGRSHQLDAKIR